MPRPMIAKDRPPDVGDKFAAADYGYLTCVAIRDGAAWGSYDDVGGGGVARIEPDYRYVTRADGGPVTVDA